MQLDVERRLGLYDPDNGIGVNPSDILLIQEDGGRLHDARALDP